jgi:hypothetical protein
MVVALLTKRLSGKETAVDIDHFSITAADNYQEKLTQTQEH